MDYSSDDSCSIRRFDPYALSSKYDIPITPLTKCYYTNQNYFIAAVSESDDDTISYHISEDSQSDDTISFISTFQSSSGEAVTTSDSSIIDVTGAKVTKKLIY